MNSALPVLKIGMLGAGVVGGQVARLLSEDHRELSTRSGARLVLSKIAVRDTSVIRPGIDPSIFTTDADSVVNDPEIDIVIEVMGGIEPAHFDLGGDRKRKICGHGQQSTPCNARSRPL